MKEIHFKAQQDDGVLEDFLPREGNARLHRLRTAQPRKDHAQQNAKYRPAHNGKFLPQQPGRHRKNQGKENAPEMFFLHKGSPLQYLLTRAILAFHV